MLMETVKCKIRFQKFTKICIAKTAVLFIVQMNHFGDLLHHEFIGAMNGYDYAAKKLLRSQHDNDRVTWIAPENVELPAAVDWRDKGKESSIIVFHMAVGFFL